MPEKPQKPAGPVVFRPTFYDRQLLERARECVAQARQVLRLPLPSTFLGERHPAAASVEERRSQRPKPP